MVVVGGGGIEDDVVITVPYTLVTIGKEEEYHRIGVGGSTAVILYILPVVFIVQYQDIFWGWGKIHGRLPPR